MPRRGCLLIVVLSCCLIGLGWDGLAVAGADGWQLAQAPPPPGKPGNKTPQGTTPPGQPKPGGQSGQGQPGQPKPGGQPGQGQPGQFKPGGQPGQPPHVQAPPPGRMPPPPPPPPGRMPPPPPPGMPGHHPCVRVYHQCVRMCGGVPECLNNCNVGYMICMQQRGGR